MSMKALCHWHDDIEFIRIPEEKMNCCINLMPCLPSSLLLPPYIFMPFRPPLPQPLRKKKSSRGISLRSFAGGGQGAGQVLAAAAF